MYTPLIFAVIGLLVYVLCNKPENAKWAELGRITYAVAFLAWLLTGGAKVLGF